MKFEPLISADLNFLKDLQPQDWGDIHPHFQYYINSPYCQPVKVVIDNKIVGIGSTIIHNTTAWLAHIIVHPEYRNKGIGKFITQCLLDSLNSTQVKTVLLIATPLGEPVYTSLGFHAETEYIFFEGKKIDLAQAENENIKPLIPAFHESLFSLDKQVSGEDRSWRLQENLEGAYMYIEKNALNGFYLPILGEGLIVARSETAGKALMHLRLKSRDNAVFPAENLAAYEVILKNGYKQTRTAKRMFLGERIHFEPIFLYNRIAGSIG